MDWRWKWNSLWVHNFYRWRMISSIFSFSPRDEPLAHYTLLLTLLFNRKPTHSIDCNIIIIQIHVKSYARIMPTTHSRTTVSQLLPDYESGWLLCLAYEKYCNLFKRVFSALVERAMDIVYECKRCLDSCSSRPILAILFRSCLFGLVVF